MTSYQAPSGSSKAAKFHAANPLGPMADPFAGLDDDQKDYQKAVSENVQQRLEKACDELKEKHASGTNEVDDPDRAPTGDPYRQLQQQAHQRDQQRRIQAQQEQAQQTQQLKELKDDLHRQAQDEESSNDDSWLDDDDDPALEAIRQARLKEMKEKQMKHAENMAKGHGQYRTIAQDDFLPECTGSSEYVCIHFFHREFERCKLMDMHLSKIAPLHTTCKFLRIDAEKAPFFVAKLQIKTLPTVLVFRDGKLIDRLTGFDGLSTHTSKPDEWPTSKLQEWLSQTGAIEYTVTTEEIQEEMERLGLTARGAIWRGGVGSYEEDD